MPPFDYEIKHEGARATVVLRGDLDISTVTEFGAVMRQLIDRGAHDIVLNLSALTHIDGMAIREVMEICNVAADEGRAIYVVEAGGHIARILEITKLAEYLKLCQP